MAETPVVVQQWQRIVDFSIRRSILLLLFVPVDVRQSIVNLDSVAVAHMDARIIRGQIWRSILWKRHHWKREEMIINRIIECHHHSTEPAGVNGAGASRFLAVDQVGRCGGARISRKPSRSRILSSTADGLIPCSSYITYFEGNRLGRSPRGITQIPPPGENDRPQ